MGNELQSQTTKSDSGSLPDVQASAAVPHGATRFRRYCLGFFDLMSALLTAWITIVNTVEINGQFLDYQAAGTHVPAGWIAKVVAVIVGLSVVSIAGLFIGIWNLS